MNMVAKKKLKASNDDPLSLKIFEITEDQKRKCGINIVEASGNVGGSRQDTREVLQMLGLKEDDEQE